MENRKHYLGTFLRPPEMRMFGNKIQTFNRDDTCPLAALQLEVEISSKFGFCPSTTKYLPSRKLTISDRSLRGFH